MWQFIAPLLAPQDALPLIYDLGSELSGYMTDLRDYRQPIKRAFFSSGKPTDNAYIESLENEKVNIAQWRTKRNESRHL